MRRHNILLSGFLGLVLLGAPVLISCGINTSTMSGDGSAPRLVQAADGTNLDISCLQQEAPQIEAVAQTDQGAASQIAMGCNVQNLASQQQMKGMTLVGFYSGYYYPGTTWAPTYYPPSYYYNASQFVNYLYGGNYNFNGLAVLGYGSYSYPYSYYYSYYGGNQNCYSTCLAGSWNYNSCINSCVYQANLYY